MPNRDAPRDSTSAMFWNHVPTGGIRDDVWGSYLVIGHMPSTGHYQTQRHLHLRRRQRQQRHRQHRQHRQELSGLPSASDSASTSSSACAGPAAAPRRAMPITAPDHLPRLVRKALLDSACASGAMGSDEEVSSRFSGATGSLFSKSSDISPLHLCNRNSEN